MKRRTGVLAVALAIMAAGCGTATNTGGPAGGQPAAGPQTFDVQVDAKIDDFVGEFTAYFPKELTVHPGDTVEFTSVFTGGPHTVTMGSLVDAGVPKAVAAGPDAQEEPPELAKIPALLPDGPGNAIQAAAQPCYLTSGDPPMNDACPQAQQQQPAFDGSATYYNSGFLADGDKFAVKLADTIKPGTYSIFCALHRTAMSGTITVVDAATPTPGPAEVNAAGKQAVRQVADKLMPTATALRTGSLPPFVPEASPGVVVAGGASPDVMEALVAEFGPKDISVPVGGTVTWSVVGPHTVSFAFPEAARIPISKAPDGSVNLNQDSVAPVDSPGAPPPEPPPTGPPAAGPLPPPTVVDGGSWNGSSFRSSGLFLSFPPQLLAYKMTFTQPGSYPYACLIHPEMKGTVKVG
jgi:plastocyanin